VSRIVTPVETAPVDGSTALSLLQDVAAYDPAASGAGEPAWVKWQGVYVPGVPTNLPRGTRQRVLGQSISSSLGNPPQPLYTCPAGVKAFFGYFAQYAQFSANGASQQVVIGRSPSSRPTAPVIGDILYVGPVGGTAPIQAAISVAMSPGDVLWCYDQNRAGGATGGYNILGSVTEIPDPSSLIVPLTGTIPSSGAVTPIYTVPAGRKAHLLCVIPDAWVGGSVYNQGSASQTIYHHVTPAAAGPSGTPAAGVRLVSSVYTLAAATAGAWPVYNMSLFAGDVLALSVAGSSPMNYSTCLLLE
jgi:hypothetical protein